MPQPRTTVLITGSKAGIGKGLLESYALRPNTTVVAAIREGPGSKPADELQSLPTGPGSRVIVAVYDASSMTASRGVVEYLQNEHNIEELDVVVANAGILKHHEPAKDVEPEGLLEHLQINTLAPILLYQSCRPLLIKSKQDPKFFIVSSNIGSNTLMDDYPFPLLAYGMSKAAVNFATGRIHREEERISVLPVQPGWVQTEMGKNAASYVGVDAKDIPVTVEASTGGLIKLFDCTTKAAYSGKFLDYNHEIVPW